MTPTNEQIIAEALRRQGEDRSRLFPDTIIEIMREGWTPPEPPVDPDLLAFREWGVERWPGIADSFRRGREDQTTHAEAYLAGARMAREQERERAEVLLAELDHFRQYGSRFDSDRAARSIAKYKEGRK